MPLQACDLAACEHIPHLHGIIHAGSGQPLAIRREGNIADVNIGIVTGEQTIPALEGRIPHAKRSVLTGSDEPFAIEGKDERRDWPAMPLENGQFLVVLVIPKSHPVVTVSMGEHLAVRGKAESGSG